MCGNCTVISDVTMSLLSRAEKMQHPHKGRLTTGREWRDSRLEDWALFRTVALTLIPLNLYSPAFSQYFTRIQTHPDMSSSATASIKNDTYSSSGGSATVRDTVSQSSSADRDGSSKGWQPKPIQPEPCAMFDVESKPGDAFESVDGTHVRLTISHEPSTNAPLYQVRSGGGDFGDEFDSSLMTQEQLVEAAKSNAVLDYVVMKKRLNKGDSSSGSGASETPISKGRSTSDPPVQWHKKRPLVFLRSGTGSLIADDGTLYSYQVTTDVTNDGEGGELHFDISRRQKEDDTWEYLGDLSEAEVNEWAKKDEGVNGVRADFETYRANPERRKSSIKLLPLPCSKGPVSPSRLRPLSEEERGSLETF